MTKLFFLLSLSFLTSYCSISENKKLSELEDKYIESYENWNLEINSHQKQDSVLYYIDELINISKDDFYKIEKIKFLYRIEKKKDALSVFNILNEQDSFSIDLLRSLIELKEDSTKTEAVLYSVYKKYESENLTINDRLYKIALDYYFKGKDFAINEISNVMSKEGVSEYDKQLYEILAEKIHNSEDRLDVLFYLYNL